MKHILIVLLAFFATSQALAIGSITAKVALVRIDQDGRGMVFFEQPVGGTPASCVNPAYTSALAFNTTSGGGKSIMALAIAAKATGSTITAYGTGNCSIYSANVEDWSYGYSQ